MNTAASRRTRAVTVAVFLVCVGPVTGQDAARVTCLPDKVVASRGDTVGVSAWAAAPSGQALQDVTVQWTVSAGLITEAGAAAIWRLDGVAVDRRYTAVADVRVNGRAVASCSLGVWVTEETAVETRLRGEFITRRAFLRPGAVADTGFGLYSYFLMREPSNAGETGRAATFTGAFLDALVAVADQDTYVERRRLNGSYLPVTMEPPPRLGVEEQRVWMREHYDYAQARRLLSLYPTLTGRGPFIIAVTAPLRGAIKPMLPWDFSDVDADAIGPAVNRFANQAAQLYDWQDQGSLQTLRDQLLTTVAGMFVGRATAERWMQIVR
ncbi:MAG: hypothetical protein ABI051_02990 [Vicinamibacterales bacterium]